MDAREEFQEGLRLYNEGQTEAAVPHFQQSAVLDSSHSSNFLNLALCYADLGQTDNALDQARAVINMTNGNPNSEHRRVAFELYFQLREGTYARTSTIQQELSSI